MPLPLIGLTSSRGVNRQKNNYLFVNEAYTAAITRSGGCPVLIPLGLPVDALQTIVGRLDGILFTGGGDVHPARYGNPFHRLVSDVDPDRDQVEIQLLRETLHTKRPFLGICRGLQVVNVALGGTLYEDLQDQRPGSSRHQFSGEKARSYLAHPVQIDEQSQLSKIIQSTTAQVNSLHHQGIHELAADLKPVAYAPDGLIEAFELPGYPFGLSVQWHPEWLPPEANMDAIFQKFIQIAADHRS
jgi:putative glutamine amidotransferase